MSSPAAVSKKIQQIELQLGKLKLMLTAKPAEKKSVQRKRKGKPESIESCKKKSDLEKFTITELKDWIKANGIDTKKLEKKHKEDFVKLVWKNLKESAKESSGESSSESSSSGSDSGSSSSDSE